MNPTTLFFLKKIKWGAVFQKKTYSNIQAINHLPISLQNPKQQPPPTRAHTKPKLNINWPNQTFSSPQTKQEEEREAMEREESVEIRGEEELIKGRMLASKSIKKA